MDPVQVRNCVKILVKMHKKGLLPDHDFYLAEVQGPAAAFYDGDFSATSWPAPSAPWGENVCRAGAGATGLLRRAPSGWRRS